MGLVLSFSKRGSVLSIWALKQEICRGRFIFEAWLSLVERCVRDAEAASSNLVASIKNKVPTRAPYSLSKQNINCGLNRNERSGRRAKTALWLFLSAVKMRNAHLAPGRAAKQ